jgi:hypothetical protein
MVFIFLAKKPTALFWVFQNVLFAVALAKGQTAYKGFAKTKF